MSLEAIGRGAKRSLGVDVRLKISWRSFLSGSQLGVHASWLR